MSIVRQLLCLFVVVLFSGCLDGGNSGGQTRTEGGKLQIVCTTGMVGDIVRQVAGDRAEVVTLFGAVDPHTYEPTAKDAERILNADAVFYSGLRLEGPTQSTLERAAKRGKPVWAVTDCLKEEPGFLRYAGEDTSHPDPHVWMDVAAWGRCTASVAQTLSQFDPAGAETYQKNAAAYLAELDRLDEFAKVTLASVPEGRRHLVTAHDAFEYFSRAYGIPVRSVQGISTESEAGTDDINQLVAFLVANKVPAVFVESTVNQANLKAVIEGAARQGWTVTIADELYSDAMGRPGTYTGSYIGMMDHNITRIARALGGTVSEHGFQGETKPQAGIAGELR